MPEQAKAERTAPDAYPPRRIPPPELGPLLRAARLRAGLGLRETARRVEISHPYLLRLESGERCPSQAIADALAEVLDLPAAEAAILAGAAVSGAGRDHPWRSGATSAA